MIELSPFMTVFLFFVGVTVSSAFTTLVLVAVFARPIFDLVDWVSRKLR